MLRSSANGGAYHQVSFVPGGGSQSHVAPCATSARSMCTLSREYFSSNKWRRRRRSVRSCEIATSARSRSPVSQHLVLSTFDQRHSRSPDDRHSMAAEGPSFIRRLSRPHPYVHRFGDAPRLHSFGGNRDYFLDVLQIATQAPTFRDTVSTFRLQSSASSRSSRSACRVAPSRKLARSAAMLVRRRGDLPEPGALSTSRCASRPGCRDITR